jgi:GT2 family glycosyltransferase
LQNTEQVRVLHYEKPFNFSAINNFAVSHARGSIVGMVNNDIEVISPDWLTEMVSWAVQPDIGCVGAKLYYPDDTIQHAGVILGIGGVAGHAHLHHARSSPGYFGRAMVVSNCSAVTGACLLIRKSVYEEVEGLDAHNLAVAFNDVDFCLRVRDRGYLNVWTPHAELYHHESASRGTDESPERRGRFVQEVNYMVERWGDSLERDPYYSVNLSRTAPAFSLLG